MPEFEIVDLWNLGDRYTFSPAVKRGNRIFISRMIERGPLTGAVVKSLVNTDSLNESDAVTIVEK